VDPDSMNPDPDKDPAFDVNPNPDPGFWWPKSEKKNTAENLFSKLFWSKIAIYLSPGLQKGRPSYRRSLEPSKENIQHFKRWNSLTVFYFWVHAVLYKQSFELDV
jgi:hypothetical protein